MANDDTDILDRHMPKELPPRVLYYQWRGEIARMLSEGWDAKTVHGAMAKADAVIAYSTLTFYLRRDSWDDLLNDDGKLDPAKLKAASEKSRAVSGWKAKLQSKG